MKSIEISGGLILQNQFLGIKIEGDHHVRVGNKRFGKDLIGNVMAAELGKLQRFECRNLVIVVPEVGECLCDMMSSNRRFASCLGRSMWSVSFGGVIRLGKSVFGT